MKSKKFEIDDEQQTQTPTFVPSYLGEKGVELDAETIRRLEAEKAALLAGLHVPSSQSWTRPAEEVVEQGSIEDAVVAPPVAPVAPGAVEVAKAAVVELQERYRFSTETRELEFKNTLAAKLKELGDLEVREAQQINQATSSRLKDVLESIRESKVADEVREAGIAVGTSRQEDLRRRAAPVRAQAAQARKLLRAFDGEYGAMLDELRAISRSDWLLGTPSEGRGAQHARSLYAQLDNMLNAILQSRDALTSMLKTDAPVWIEGELSGGFEAELDNLITQAARGWDQNLERQWVWALSRLVLATPDAVASLQQGVRGLIGAVEPLRNMQSPKNTEHATGIQMIPERVKFPTVNTGEGWSGLTGGR